MNATTASPINTKPPTWRWIDLPHATDPRGTMTFLEHELPLPFEVRRIYYLLDLAPNAARGDHAHRRQEQIIIPLAGAFTAHIDNGLGQTGTLRLDSPYRGLYFGPLHWHHLSDFTAGAVCLILSSCVFRDEDYLRDYPAFLGVRTATP